jgi:formamidopyrimidine-DNA glycosylase
MPELPHVAGLQRYAEAVAVGRRVVHTRVGDRQALEQTTPAALARGVTGHHLAAARRHGKYLGLALDESLDRDWFLERLARKRGTVKNALMDQSLLAGIGSEYAGEILFQLGLHPGVALDDLDDARRRELRRVLAVGAERGGDTAALPRGWLSRGRAERRCPRCGGDLDKTEVAGRSTWFCPRRAGAHRRL